MTPPHKGSHPTWLKVGQGWGGWGCTGTGTGYVGVKVVMLHHRLQLQAWGMGLVMSPVMVACMEG